MSKKTRRQPKIAYSPSDREPRARANPLETDSLTPAWQFHRCDEDHALWGWQKLTSDERLKIIQNLCAFERMTWGDIKRQAEGNGTNHHSLSTGEFTKDARNRLEALKLDEYDELFSLRLGNKTRLYGIKDGRVLRFIWHDPYHGEDKGAYPTKRR